MTLKKQETSVQYGEKLHQQLKYGLVMLENILAGYTLPDPFFKTRMKDLTELIMKCLKDPLLPLLELQVYSSKVSCMLKSFHLLSINFF